jgi:hypothetical protein
MAGTLLMTLRVELAWIFLETTAMAVFGVSYAIHVKRIRLAKRQPAVSRPLASVVCIDRH